MVGEREYLNECHYYYYYYYDFTLASQAVMELKQGSQFISWSSWDKAKWNNCPAYRLVESNGSFWPFYWFSFLHTAVTELTHLHRLLFSPKPKLSSLSISNSSTFGQTVGEYYSINTTDVTEFPRKKYIFHTFHLPRTLY